MNKLLLVVDMQNDFVNGSLGTEEAKNIVPKVVAKVEKYYEINDENNYDIWFTRDTHFSDYLNTQEGRNLPVEHCIDNTDGWCIISELSSFTQRNCILIDKLTFASKELVSRYDLSVYDEIELIGVCTDICVISNALLIKAFYPEIEITVDASCCAGVTPEKHKAAIETMKSCQIRIINEGA